MIGIYKFTNKKNGKVYIGQSIDIESRYKNHLRSCYTPKCNRYNKLLYKAIRKNGIENFDFEIIEECKKEELNDKEKYYITLYKSSNLDYGYNLTDGGDSSSNRFQKPIYQVDIETKSIINSFRNCFEASRELGLNQGNIRHCCDGKYKYAYGYLWCYQDKYLEVKNLDYDFAKMKYCRTKECKKIYQYTLDGKLVNVYLSMKQLKEKTNYRRTAIYNCITGISNSSNGYYWSYSNTFDKNVLRNKKRERKPIKKINKKIYQYDLNNNLINEFENVNEVNKLYNFPKKRIYDVCEGRRKSAYKYKWSY